MDILENKAYNISLNGLCKPRRLATVLIRNQHAEEATY